MIFQRSARLSRTNQKLHELKMPIFIIESKENENEQKQYRINSIRKRYKNTEKRNEREEANRTNCHKTKM